MNFTFEIVSARFGTVSVIAPERFRDEIEKHSWSLVYCDHRAEGRRLMARTWIPHPDGGLRACGKRKRRKGLMLHQLVWALMGNASAKLLDHADGQPLNNAEDNLRAATPKTNSWNRRITTRNTSGAIGVDWRKDMRKWRARIQDSSGRPVWIEYFDDFAEAVSARDVAAKELRGVFAVLNVAA